MNYEVVIVGGGLTGVSLAWALQRHHLRIALVESAPLAPPHDTHTTHYDDRVIALSYGSYHFYRQNQLELLPLAAPIRHIHISDRGQVGVAHLDAQHIHQPALGFVIEAKLLGVTLQHLLQTQSSVDLIAPQTVVNVKLTAKTAQLQLQSGEVLQAKLVILADGGQSTLYQQLEIHFKTHDYQQTAIIATVTPAKVKIGYAFERFTHSGPLALLPMRNNNYAVVWTVKPAQVEDILNMQDADFLKELQQVFGWRLGQFLQVGKRSAFPLMLRFTKDLFRPRLLLMGNAAHLIHPVGGQGLNLSIRDISTFVKLLNNKPQDIGALSFLQTYANQRDPDIQKTLQVTDGLVKLFSNDFKLISIARNLGLLAFDLCPFLKEKFARQLAGL